MLLQSGFLDSFPFDPLGQNSTDMQLREIKNGRLAMVRSHGCYAYQSYAMATVVLHRAALSSALGRYYDCSTIAIELCGSNNYSATVRPHACCPRAASRMYGFWAAAATRAHRLSYDAAQVAFIGFAVQALVTREQPIEGLTNHLSNPFGHNIITNIGNLPVSINRGP